MDRLWGSFRELSSRLAGGRGRSGSESAYEPAPSTDSCEDREGVPNVLDGVGGEGGTADGHQRVIHLNPSSSSASSLSASSSAGRQQQQQQQKFPDNTLRSAKYTPLTFLPIFLSEQFGTPMNLYFLMIACLQLWKAITPINPVTTWAPLILVLAVSAAKEMSEDRKRKEADLVANSKPFDVYRSGAFHAGTRSRDIRVGDVVVLRDGDEAPCDLFLLRAVKSGGAHAGGLGAAPGLSRGQARGAEARTDDSDDDDGDAGSGASGDEDEDDNMALSAYVETSNLDGETDLKPRLPCPEIQCLPVATVVGQGHPSKRLEGKLICEAPNAELYRFDASFYGHVVGTSSSSSSASSSSFKVSLSASNLIQHGTILRSTGAAYCLVCYTGHQTKLSQNKQQASAGTSTSSPEGAGAGAAPSGFFPLLLFLIFSLFERCCGRLSSYSRCCLSLRVMMQRQRGLFGRRRLRGGGGGSSSSGGGGGGGRGKRSVVDRAINRLVVFIFLAQLVLVIVFGAMGTLHNGGGPSDGRWYLGWGQQEGPLHQLASPSALYTGTAGSGSDLAPEYRYHPAGDDTISPRLRQEGEGAGADTVDPDDYVASIREQERLARDAALAAEHEQEHRLRSKKQLEDTQKLMQQASASASTHSSAAPVSSTGPVRRFDGHKDEDLGRGPAGAIVSRKAALLASAASAAGGASAASAPAAAEHAADHGFSSIPPSSSSSPYSWFFFLVNSAVVILPLRFLLLSSMLIPISLKVSLDLVKVLYGRWVQGDVEMAGSRAANTSVIEDLGRVDIVLSDKTGTLTDNRMVTAAVSVRGQLYCVDQDLLVQHQQQYQQGQGERTPFAPPPQDLDTAAAAALASLRSQRREQQAASQAPAAIAGGKQRTSFVHPPKQPRHQQEEQHRLLIDFFKALVLCSSVEPARKKQIIKGQAGSSSGKQGGKAVANSSSPSAGAVAERGQEVDEEKVALMMGSVKSPDPAASPMPLSSPAGSPALQPLPVEPLYSSASPDESALVTTAASCGVQLVSRRHDKGGKQRIAIRVAAPADNGDDEGEQEQEYEVLHVLEFTSARKCMSVVVRRVDKGRAKGRGSTANPSAAGEVRGRQSISANGGASSDSSLDFGNHRHASQLPSPMYRAAHSHSHSHVTGDSAPAAVTDGYAGGFSGGYAGVDSDELILITKGADEVLAKMLTANPFSASDATAAADAEAAVVSATFNGDLKLLASKGLRTLVVAGRTISPEEYRAWLPIWERAHHHHHHQQPQQAPSTGGAGAAAPGSAVVTVAQACSMLEKRLTLLGCTAIEDALQQGVPHAVSDLLRAGVKVWMLTGDKAETAVQIGKACNLIPSPSAEYSSGNSKPSSDSAVVAMGPAANSALPELPSSAALPLTQIFTIKAATELELSSQLRSLASALGEQRALGIASPTSVSPPASIDVEVDSAARDSSPRFSIVVDGITTLNLLLNHHPYNETFARLSTSSKVVSVLCCRCTPQQKASIVRLLKSPALGNGRAPLTTLAIGDGGNDVGMIQTADVGVGLEGNEGKHAARAADFALPQFRLLPRLILVHGRLSYYRTALISQYTFYKSACIGLVQLLYNSWCGYSGCSLLDSFALTSYNMVFTFVPAIMMTVDVDVDTGGMGSSSSGGAGLSSWVRNAMELFFVSFLGRVPPGLSKKKAQATETCRPPRQQQEAALTLLRKPYLYPLSSKGETFLSFRGFAVTWLGRAVYQSVALLVIFAAALDHGASDGASVDQQTLSYAIFTTLVALQLVTVAFSMASPTALNALTSVGFGALYLFLLVLKDLASGSTSLLGFFGSPTVLLASVLALLVCCLGWVIPLPLGICALTGVSALPASLWAGLSRRMRAGSGSGSSPRNVIDETGVEERAGSDAGVASTSRANNTVSSRRPVTTEGAIPSIATVTTAASGAPTNGPFLARSGSGGSLSTKDDE